MLRRPSGSSPRTGCPITRTSPAYGRIRPARMRSSVVFPAPLGPATTTASPGRTARSSPRSTRSPPNERLRPRASNSALPVAPSEDGIDAGAELVESKGFDDVTRVRKVEHLELGLDAQVRGGDDDEQGGVRDADPPQQLEASGCGQ